MVTKSDLHRMIDELRDDEVEEAARLLRDLDRLPPILAEAEEDDEPLTEEEEWMLQESAKDIKAGRIHSHEEIKREFGLSVGGCRGVAGRGGSYGRSIQRSGQD